jgi:hypothetical protein
MSVVDLCVELLTTSNGQRQETFNEVILNIHTKIYIKQTESFTAAYGSVPKHCRQVQNEYCSVIGTASESQDLFGERLNVIGICSGRASEMVSSAHIRICILVTG